MATDDEMPTDRTALYTDLYSRLCAAHRGAHQSKMAQALLRADADGSRLVALEDDCERAVFFNTASRSLESVPFDEHGVSPAEGDVLWRQLGDPASWVDAHAADCDWIHPHYRWACELDGEETWTYEAPS